MEELEDYEVMAMGVVFGELDGGEFSWSQMKWMDKQ